MRLIAAMSFVMLLAIASSAQAQGERINVQGVERTYLLVGQKKPARLRSFWRSMATGEAVRNLPAMPGGTNWRARRTSWSHCRTD